MSFRWNSSFAILGLILTGGFSSGDISAAADLPASLGREHFKALLTRSPFLRTLDLSETYELRGLAQIGSEPVATLYNRETRKSVQVTANDAGDLGMKLVAVNPGSDLTGVSVRIAFGGEEVELKYQSQRIAPSPKPQKSSPASSHSKGRAQPPKELVKKYYSMNSDQRRTYYRWRETYYRAHPGLKDSEKRFPVVDRAIDAIKAGKEPPKP